MSEHYRMAYIRRMFIVSKPTEWKMYTLLPQYHRTVRVYPVMKSLDLVSKVKFVVVVDAYHHHHHWFMHIYNLVTHLVLLY